MLLFVHIEVTAAGLALSRGIVRQTVLTSHDCTPGYVSMDNSRRPSRNVQAAALSACTHSRLTRVGRFVPYGVNSCVRGPALRVLACLVATLGCLPPLNSNTALFPQTSPDSDRRSTCSFGVVRSRVDDGAALHIPDSQVRNFGVCWEAGTASPSWQHIIDCMRAS
jgi:hypothetical protein